MSVLQIVIAIFAGVVVYALIGWAATVHRLPRIWRTQRAKFEGWDSLYEATKTYNIRTGVHNHALAMFFAWPIAYPYSYAYDHFTAHPVSFKKMFEQFIDRYDPEKVKPCPEPPEPKTPLLLKEPSSGSSPVTKVLSGLTRSAHSRQR